MEDAVVKEDALARDVAQRRRAEQSAVFGSFREIGAQRAAQAEIVIARIAFAGMAALRGTPSAAKPKSVNCGNAPSRTALG